jgi:DNA polymerase III epsilon subunit-like protein
MKTYSALPHLNGNLLCAVDIETTGNRPRYHEPIQIAIVPLNSDLRPLRGVRAFYTDIQPLHIERADGRATAVHQLPLEELAIHAPSRDKVVDMLVEWFEGLDLPFEKQLVPLAHNWAFEASFFKAWWGVPLLEKLFHPHPRDAMQLALAMNDRSVFKGEKAPFNRVGLGSLCNVFNIINPKAHDAYHDCLAEAEVYRCLLLMDQF